MKVKGDQSKNVKSPDVLRRCLESSKTDFEKKNRLFCSLGRCDKFYYLQRVLQVISSNHTISFLFVCVPHSLTS